MNGPNIARACVVSCLLAGWLAGMANRGLEAQELAAGEAARLPLLEHVRDVSTETLFLDELPVVNADVRRLLDDLGFGNLLPDGSNLFQWELTGEALHPGVVIHRWGDSIQVRARSVPAVLAALDAGEPPPEDRKSFALGQGFSDPGLYSTIERAVFDGEDLLLVAKAWNDNREEDRVRQWLDHRDQLLWPHLDPASRSIIAQSGAALHNRLEDDAWIRDIGADEQLRAFREELTAAEQEWLVTLRDAVAASERQVLGLKYHERLMEIRARAQAGAEKPLTGLVRAGSGAETWPADLGLERERLVLAVAIQMNAFPNSAAARTLPRLGLFSGGSAEGFQWLRGNMLRTLTELVGDSWNDLDAGRVALYLGNEAEKAGQLALIGVADARDPAVVLRELERMSRLTSPEAASVKGYERDQEIARLIADLSSDDPNVADRAESRLALAGRAAIPALKEAAEGWGDARRASAERLLRRLEAGPGEVTFSAVADPGFWTTLNPGLRLELSTGEVAGCPLHTIHVTPDPSKSEAEVAEAIQLMKGLFGPDWATIRVVQTGNHFVFLIGSDLPLLQRTVENVRARRQLLGTDLLGKGHCVRAGQLQLWVHGSRIGQLMMSDWANNNWGKNGDNDQPAWLGAKLDETGVEVSALIPVEHLIPVVTMFAF